MPTYEYECQKCGHHFELFQSITAEPVKDCPKCQGPVQKLISGGGGLLFKGSGFYTTDYRSSEYKSKTKQESQSESKSSESKSSESSSQSE